MVVMFTQGAATSQAWSYRTVGDLGLDGVAGLAAADSDGDGDNDLIVGSEGGGPSDADKQVEPAAYNDIFRRERGRFNAFLPSDVDGDGDIDVIGLRSNSGDLDGLFWLQQLHSPDAVVRLQPARRASSDSLALPLP